MKLQIEISDESLNESVSAATRQAVNRMFSCETRDRAAGECWNQIHSITSTYLTSPEAIESIRAEIKRAATILTPQIVREAVTEELRKHAKRIVKEEVHGQTLFSQTKP